MIVKERSVVLQGSRRVGKTSVLLYIKDWLERQGKRTVYYDLAFPGTPDLEADLIAKGFSGQEVFVFLDNWRPTIQLMANSNRHLIAAAAWKFALPPAIKTVELLPLSFNEWLEFSEKGEILAGNWPELYREFIMYGGYPEVVLEPLVETKKQRLWQILDMYLRKDLTDLGQINDMAKFFRLLAVLAGQAGKVADMMALSREAGMSFPTLKKYLAVLEQSFLIQKLPPYSRHPGVEISQSPKLLFLDSGLQSLLWLKSFSPAILEPMFKTNVFGELVKKVGRGAVKYWRTKAGAEVDFVVQKPGGELLAIDAAINFQQFNAKNIGLFKRRYDPKRWRLIGLEGEKLAKNGFYPWEI